MPSSLMELDAATCWAIPAPPLPPPISSSPSEGRPEAILLRIPDRLLSQLLATAHGQQSQACIELNRQDGPALLLDGQSYALESSQIEGSKEDATQYFYRLEPGEEKTMIQEDDRVPQLLTPLPTPTLRMVRSIEPITNVLSSSSLSAPSSSSSLSNPPSSSGSSSSKNPDLVKATNRLKAMREAAEEKKRQSRAILIDQSQFDARGRLKQTSRSTPSRDHSPVSGPSRSASRDRGSAFPREAGMPNTGFARTKSQLALESLPVQSRSASPVPVPTSSLPRPSSQTKLYRSTSSTQILPDGEAGEDDDKETIAESRSSPRVSLSPVKSISKTASSTRARLTRAAKGKGPKGEELKKQQEKERRRLEKAREEQEKEMGNEQGNNVAAKSLAPAASVKRDRGIVLRDATSSDAKVTGKIGGTAAKKTSEDALQLGQVKKPIPSDSAIRSSKETAPSEASTAGTSPTREKKRKRDTRAPTPENTDEIREVKESFPKKVSKSQPSSDEGKSKVKKAAPSSNPATSLRPSLPVQAEASDNASARTTVPPLTTHHGPSASASLATREPWLDLRGLNDWRHLVERHARVLAQYEACRVRLEEEKQRLIKEKDRAARERERERREQIVEEEEEEDHLSQVQRLGKIRGKDDDDRKDERMKRVSVSGRASGDEELAAGPDDVDGDGDVEEPEEGALEDDDEEEDETISTGDNHLRLAPTWRDSSPSLSSSPSTKFRLSTMKNSTTTNDRMTSSSRLPQESQITTTTTTTRTTSSTPPPPPPPPPPPMDLVALMELVELQRSREGELKRMFIALDSFKRGWDEETLMKQAK